MEQTEVGKPEQDVGEAGSAPSNPKEKIKQNEVQVEAQIEYFRTAISNLEDQFAKSETNINEQVKDANKRLSDFQESASEYQNSVRKFLYITWFGGLSIFVGALIFLVVQGLGLELVLIEGVVTLAILASLLVIGYRRIPKNPYDKKVEIDPSLTEPKASLASGRKIANDILSVLRETFPQINLAFKLEEKQYSQDHVSKTMRNALQDFDIEVTKSVDEILRKFNSVSENQQEWIDGLSGHIAKESGVDKSIILLGYYDYIGSGEDVKNQWKDILESREKQDDKLSKFVSHLLKNRYPALSTDLNGGIGAFNKMVAGLNPFSIQSLDKRVDEFYIKLAKRKLIFVDALRSFGYSLDSDLIEKIMKFPPDSSDPSKWEDELIGFIADQKKEERRLLELILTFNTNNSIERQHAWESMKHNDDIVEPLLDILIKGRLSEHVDLAGGSKVRPLLKKILVDAKDFRLDDFSAKLFEKLEQLKTAKQFFLQAAEFFQIPVSESDRQNLDTFMTAEEPVNGVAGYLSQLRSIDSKILTLLYYDYIQDVKTEKLWMKSVIESEVEVAGRKVRLSQKLAELFIEYGFINSNNTDREDSTKNLETLIRLRSSHKLVTLPLEFATYNILLDHCDGLLNFIRNQGLADEEFILDISRLVSIISRSEATDLYQQLKLVCQSMVAPRYRDMEDEKKRRSVIASILSIYLKDKEDGTVANAYVDSGHLDWASKILYRFIEKREMSKDGSSVRLDEVIQEVFEQADVGQYKHLIIFQRHLANGFMHPTIGSMIHTIEVNIDGQWQLSPYKAQLEEKLEAAEMRKAIEKFLNTKLKKEIVAESLSAGIVSAYMVTSTSKEGLMEVFGETLKQAIARFETKEENRKKILIEIGKEAKAAGKGTRIGLIPPGMTFEQFEPIFREFFDGALRLHIEKKGEDGGQLSDYEYNLFKINPSDATFKHIIPGEGADDSSDRPNHPLNIIKGLMIKNFKSVKNLGIIASVTKSDSGLIALKEVVRDLLDHEESRIYSLIADSVNGILPNRKPVIDTIKSEDFDRKLFVAYGCGSLTEFAITIYKTVSLTPKEAALSRLKHEVSSILESHRPKLTDDEITGICNVIITEMEPIGMFLNR